MALTGLCAGGRIVRVRDDVPGRVDDHDRDVQLALDPDIEDRAGGLARHEGGNIPDACQGDAVRPAAARRWDKTVTGPVYVFPGEQALDSWAKVGSRRYEAEVGFREGEARYADHLSVLGDENAAALTSGDGGVGLKVGHADGVPLASAGHDSARDGRLGEPLHLPGVSDEKHLASSLQVLPVYELDRRAVVEMGPSSARSASKSHLARGTSRCSEPSDSTTRTRSNGQTTCALVSTYPPRSNVPLPVAVGDSMNTIDGDTRAKISAAVSGRGVGDGVAVAVGVGDGVAVGVCVGSGDGVAVAVRVGVGGGAAVGVCVGAGDGVAMAVCVGTGVGVAEAVAVGVAVGGTVGAAVDVACEAVGRSAVGSRQPFKTAAAATRARIEEAP